ncbi:C-X-C motif chemokine 6-like [Siniperca chuatsi]|uniref:Interleukin-8-like protein n=1 Tax=Siniperca chuatsi TaxID=119488 RepID=Q2KKU7_SINCH|nr:C-X-C motif chemokine 6-like [Siniperca chuatsi]AAY79282.2 interleukin-8-like protein [Siniperca chuatsi]
MSSIMKVFLLLAVMVCISKAQLHQSGQRCLCNRIRSKLAFKSEVKDIQIYPVNIFCNKVEIVVTLKRGFRYCLDPKLDSMKKLLANIIKQKTSTTARPTELTSTPGSTNTARI